MSANSGNLQYRREYKVEKYFRGVHIKKPVIKPIFFVVV